VSETSEDLPLIECPLVGSADVDESWLGALAASHGPALRWCAAHDPAPTVEDMDALRLWMAKAVAMAADYGVVYLLLVLHRLDPDAAETAGRMLATAWNAGDAMGEWLWQWGEEHREGRPFTVPGFPHSEVS